MLAMHDDVQPSTLTVSIVTAPVSAIHFPLCDAKVFAVMLACATTIPSNMLCVPKVAEEPIAQ